MKKRWWVLSTQLVIQMCALQEGVNLVRIVQSKSFDFPDGGNKVKPSARNDCSKLNNNSSFQTTIDCSTAIVLHPQ